VRLPSSISLPRGRSFLLLAQKKQNQRKGHPIARISLFPGVRELAALGQRTHYSGKREILKRDKGVCHYTKVPADVREMNAHRL